MGDDATLTVKTRDHVAHVRFGKPPHNHIDTDLTRRLADALDTLDADPDCRVVLLSSEGRVFCAGADFGAGRFDPEPFYTQVLRLFRTKKPIVVAVQGAAIGAGLGLAVAADFRIAGASARFAANFTRLGIHPGFGLSVTLPRLIGQQHAADLFLTGRRIGHDEAARIGLVDRLVADGDLIDAATAFAREIAISAPHAVQSVRETMRMGLADAVTEANKRECALQQVQFDMDDFREGTAAMAERRAPNFTGR